MPKPHLAGALIGTAVGDSIGLPTEGLSRQRISKRLGERPLEHRFLFGRGMISDDTEHACLVLQAYVDSQGDLEAFRRRLAWKLRGWFATFPAGIGLATAKACLRLWLGWSPQRSGVSSAGNGPCMRSIPLGAAWKDDPARLAEWVDASSLMTHRDARAVEGARILALCAFFGRDQIFDSLAPYVQTPEWREALDSIARARNENLNPAAFAEQLGGAKAVSGYVMHSVPVAIYVWLTLGHDFRAAIEQIVRLGGDTDTTAAFVGGLIGAEYGEGAIPDAWRAGVKDYPRSIEWMRDLARASDQGGRYRSLVWPAIPLRNAVFLLAVLGHGFGRLFRS